MTHTLIAPHMNDGSPLMFLFGTMLMVWTTFSTGSAYSTTRGGDCHLPNSWAGRWFQSGHPQPLLITGNSIETKGICRENSEDKFLFFERARGYYCYRCVIIIQRHVNVLQYKESAYCEDKDELENICSLIPGDAQLYSLFRLDAPPVECPFRGGPFEFTYNRGYGECRNPVSRVELCTQSSRLLLRYQACPDVRKTESYAEELECVGQWRDSTQNYLVGKVRSRLAVSLEDKYRCFVYERMRSRSGSNGVTTVGYRVAQSGDATCGGLSSDSEGARTMTWIKAEQSLHGCKFPSWLSTPPVWNSLDGSKSLRVHQRNSSLHVEGTADRNSVEHEREWVAGDPMFHSPAFTPGSRIACQSAWWESAEDRFLAFLGSQVLGCHHRTFCVHVLGRSGSVVEIRFKDVRELSEDSDCGRKGSLDGEPLLTFVAAEQSPRPCPFRGKFLLHGDPENVGIEYCAPTDGEPTAAAVGCEEASVIQVQDCGLNALSNSLSCREDWTEENGQNFMVITSMSASSRGTARRYCVASKLVQNRRVTFFSSLTCPRDGAASFGRIYALNFTKEGECDVGTSSANTIPRVIRTIVLSSVLGYLILTFHSPCRHPSWLPS